MLFSYDWPGNIRELQNVVERALILERNKPVLTFSDFLPCSLHATEDTPVSTLEDAEKEHIKKSAAGMQQQDQRQKRSRRTAGDQSKHTAQQDAQARTAVKHLLHFPD